MGWAIVLIFLHKAIFHKSCRLNVVLSVYSQTCLGMPILYQKNKFIIYQVAAVLTLCCRELQFIFTFSCLFVIKTRCLLHDREIGHGFVENRMWFLSRISITFYIIHRMCPPLWYYMSSTYTPWARIIYILTICSEGPITFGLRR